jgi:putative SOS response-associated peptidase YedK
LCSRYSLTSPPEAVRSLFDAATVDDFPPRHSIAPTEPVLIFRLDERGRRELQLVRWGLIPSWSKDPRTHAAPLINARAETAAEKPAFRGPMRHRRCIVPTTGFYEWSGPRCARQPNLIRLKNRDVFALAGLWERWLGADGSEIDTMAILTTAANGDIAPLHDRMPVIIEPSEFGRWLDCRSGSADVITDLLRPIAEGRLSITAVDRGLNNPRVGGPELQQPVVRDLFDGL